MKISEAWNLKLRAVALHSLTGGISNRGNLISTSENIRDEKSRSIIVDRLESFMSTLALPSIA
mgnify:CR=1 FL=1